jgi:uncharacterized protein YjbJ (UPF0337 family)
VRTFSAESRAAGQKTTLGAPYTSTPLEMKVNTDQVKGRIKEAQGVAKEIAGALSENKVLEQKGEAQRAVGKIQTAYGDLKEDIKEGS